MYVPDIDEQVSPIMELDARRRRDMARVWIAAILGATFLITLIWTLAVVTFKPAAWAIMKEALLIVLPVESSLLGAAVAYYFAGSGVQR